jgi:hypothetical protein
MDDAENEEEDAGRAAVSAATIRACSRDASVVVAAVAAITAVAARSAGVGDAEGNNGGHLAAFLMPGKK